MKHFFKAAISAAMLAVPASADELIRAQVSAPGATAYIVTTHLANVLKQRHGYNVEVATGFPGVRSQVNNANGEADLTLYAPALAFFLNKGIAMYQGLENHAELAAELRPLFTYQGDMFTFGTYDPEIKTLADIEGKRVFLGPKGAALVRINSGLIEAATGLVAGDDYELVHVDWPGSAALLQDGSVDILFQLCAPGCATWTELSSGRNVTFVGYTEDMVAEEGFQKQLQFPGRTMTTIEPGTWGDGQANADPVHVITEFTGLTGSAEMSDEVAYDITKAFWETKDELAEIAPFVDRFDIKDATFGMINQIHPGAAKYFTEQGVALPGQ